MEKPQDKREISLVGIPVEKSIICKPTTPNGDPLGREAVRNEVTPASHELPITDVRAISIVDDMNVPKRPIEAEKLPDGLEAKVKALAESEPVKTNIRINRRRMRGKK